MLVVARSSNEASMLTLHEYTPSQNCWKVRVHLGLLGIPYRSEAVAIFSGESSTPEFLQLNPAGSTPVLVLEDGRAIAESNAILCYLAGCTRFMPPDTPPDGRFARQGDAVAALRAILRRAG